MSDLQTKLGNGMNKLQEGIEQGKMKLQIAQEIAQLKKEIGEQLQKKTEILLDLGQRTYVQLRNGSVQEEELQQLIAPVQQIDVAIYKARKKIGGLQQQQGAQAVCACGGVLTSADKFCGQCGKPNQMMAKEQVVETIPCSSCSEHIAKESTFCPACGMKQDKE
ncbi:zinc ribbon domain-containing protein [Bacillus sp. S14(2024)]|uniref:zinc ribbon domain-containing protein n=1 Tax=Bacillus sp. S14(2024) TaxID=3162884 RepID=UPI003D19CDA3